MMKTQLKVAMVYTAVPHYRRDFYRRLNLRDDVELTLFCQSHLPGFNLELIHQELDCEVVEVPFWGRETQIVWQNLPVIRLWREFDVIVFYGLPRIVSNVLWATLFRMLGKPIVIYGQAFSYRAAPRTEQLRLNWWRRRFSHFLVYTDKEAELMVKEHHFDKHIVRGINNGLNQERIEKAKSEWDVETVAQWQSEQEIEERPIVLSVARLVPKNQFDVVISVLPQLLQSVPDLLWCVIGDGELRESLQFQAKELGVDAHIRWLGAIYEEEELAPWFLSSDVMVHPAGIGLSLNHAFGYGVPVVTHDQIKKHNPEIAVLKDKVNGFLYEEGNDDALCHFLITLLQDESLRREMGERALETVRTEYNTAVMANRYAEIVWDVYRAQER